ncbi:MAG: MarR family transcriptional regulator [Syntrophomonadaceae bacterium]
MKGAVQMDNEAKVMAAFKQAGKPLSSKEVAELSGLEKKDVDKIIKKLKEAEKIHSPKRCYYEPK